METDDVILDSGSSEVFVFHYPDKDGLIEFTCREKINCNVFKATLLSHSGKVLAAGISREDTEVLTSGIFHKDDFGLDNTVRIKISGENKDKFQIHYVSTSKSYGFLREIFVWVPKEAVYKVTDRKIMTVKDGNLVPMTCEDCGKSLVLAVNPRRTLLVCSECIRVSHIA